LRGVAMLSSLESRLRLLVTCTACGIRCDFTTMMPVSCQCH